jgi:preprotein translocase subunit YajC
MDYRDVRVGQRVEIVGGLTGEVVEVDPRRLESGDPVRVRLRMPVTGTHTIWEAHERLTLRSQG